MQQFRKEALAARQWDRIRLSWGNYQVGGSFANQSAEYLDGQPLEYRLHQPADC